MQQLATVYQKYITQMTNPSTPTFKNVGDCSPSPLKIDVPAYPSYRSSVNVILHVFYGPSLDLLSHSVQALFADLFSCTLSSCHVHQISVFEFSQFGTGVLPQSLPAGLSSLHNRRIDLVKHFFQSVMQLCYATEIVYSCITSYVLLPPTRDHA